MKLVKKIVEIYEQEIDLYQELLSLTKQQTKVIKEDELDELEQLLTKKEEIMKQIDNLEKRVAPYRKKIIEELNLEPKSWLVELAKYEKTDSKVKNILYQLRDIIEELTKADNKNRELIEKNKREIMQELKEVREGSKANNSYTKKKRIYSTYIDEKS